MLARPCRSCKPKNIPPHRCGPAVQAPTSKRQGLRKNSFALSKFHRRGEHCSPALAAPAPPKIFPRTVAGLQCRPLQAIGKACIKILPLFQNFIVGAGLGSARPCRACTPKNHPRTESGPAMQAPTSNRQGLRKTSIALSKFHRRGEHCSPALSRTRRPKKITPAPRGKILPAHPKRPFCRKNENSLKNLPHAVNKLTLVSVTFHPRAFIINLSKHCLPRVQNGAAAWF